MKSISHHPDNKGILHSYVLPVTWVMEVIPEERDGWWEPRRGTWRNIFQKMGTTLWDLEDYLLKIYAVTHNLADLTTDWLRWVFSDLKSIHLIIKWNKQIHLIIKWNRQVQVVPQIICHRSHLFQNFTDDCWSWKWGWHSLWIHVNDEIWFGKNEEWKKWRWTNSKLWSNSLFVVAFPNTLPPCLVSVFLPPGV